MKTAANAINDVIEVKCPRCGTLNNLRPVVPMPSEPVPDRQERPLLETACAGNSFSKTP
ncbi:Com family DNA-binding transcriptional regulator [Roseibium sp. TrichSKD4]|uniref:Com family DNA-binding transcriptional regulator n=1 Tax=Roseibium sp. TrichSKD4 TaxID=744980 RepID=UPI003528ABA7